MGLQIACDSQHKHTPLKHAPTSKYVYMNLWGPFRLVYHVIRAGERYFLCEDSHYESMAHPGRPTQVDKPAVCTVTAVQMLSTF